MEDTSFELRFPTVAVIDVAEAFTYTICFVAGWILTTTLGVLPTLAIIALFYVFEVLIPGRFT